MSINFAYCKILRYQGILLLTSLLVNHAQVLAMTLQNSTVQEGYLQSSININTEEIAQNLMYTSPLADISIEDVGYQGGNSDDLSSRFRSKVLVSQGGNSGDLSSRFRSKVLGSQGSNIEDISSIFQSKVLSSQGGNSGDLTSRFQSKVSVSQGGNSGDLTSRFQSIVSSFKQLKFSGKEVDYSNPEVRILPGTNSSDVFKDVYYSAIIGRPKNTDPGIQNSSQNIKIGNPNRGNLSVAPTNSGGSSIGVVMNQISQFGNLNIRAITSLPRYSPLANLNTLNYGTPTYNFENKKSTKYTRNDPLDNIPTSRGYQLRQQVNQASQQQVQESLDKQREKYKQLTEEQQQREKVEQQKALRDKQLREETIKKRFSKNQVETANVSRSR